MYRYQTVYLGLMAAVVFSLITGAVSVPVAAAEPAAEPALRAQSRPKLSGDELTYGTPHFVIHYTYHGIDGVPPADLDENGIPDWVEEVGAVMEHVRRVQVDRLGWPAPLPDRGEGGDERFDVYLMELFSRNLAGYVSPDGGFVGDNPHTPRTEGQAAYGYMVLENDFIDPNPPAGLTVWPPEEWLRIIAAHEFNHVLQIAINGIHPMRWWYEATANWMETQVYPDLPDNLNSAGAVFKSPDTCMLRYGGVNRVEDGLHWYGMWVFAQVLTETYGADMVVDIWHRMADTGGYGPFDDAFAARGTDFPAELRRFAWAVLLRDFAGGDDYPVARLQEAVSGPGVWNPVDGVQRYAMDYIGLDLDRMYTVTVSAEDAGVEGVVVGVRNGSADIFPAGQAITVDFSAYDHAYLVVINQTRPPNEAGCATARYTYTVQDPGAEPSAGDGADSVPAAPETVADTAPDLSPAAPEFTLDVPYFAPPRVEAVTDPQDLPIMDPFYQTEYNIREEIQQVDVPFSPITPRGAPDGYELDSVYGVDADTFGEDFVALNAPSGGVVVQMLYYNDAGQLIRITQSPSVYVTIGEWLAVHRLEFAPGTQIWTAGSVDTAIVDPSRTGEGPFMIAFIVKNRFMVIDGDADREDMLDMARRFASSFGAADEVPAPRFPGGAVYGGVVSYAPPRP